MSNLDNNVESEECTFEAGCRTHEPNPIYNSGPIVEEPADQQVAILPSLESTHELDTAPSAHNTASVQDTSQAHDNETDTELNIESSACPDRTARPDRIKNPPARFKDYNVTLPPSINHSQVRFVIFVWLTYKSGDRKSFVEPADDDCAYTKSSHADGKPFFERCTDTKSLHGDTGNLWMTTPLLLIPPLIMIALKSTQQPPPRCKSSFSSTSRLTKNFSYTPPTSSPTRPLSLRLSSNHAAVPISPVLKKKQSITFADVEGVDAAKAELLEIVLCIKGDSKYMKLGAKLPRGVLLAGPPGTGKTLLARAVAGEADVAFFSMSASEFVEIFPGRDLFHDARKRSPSIIFIDEIDAVIF
ncbi:unnamed protein product [Lactuca saligna]|uniref:ATPase AAA-type core domain-containing protein n=1 Tax=Lactuca saligna TaxID=75948 RepID=A0AA35Z661_LACSI|nr:unnamed protein product [Lactuca saligna]